MITKVENKIVSSDQSDHIEVFSRDKKKPM